MAPLRRRECRKPVQREGLFALVQVALERESETLRLQAIERGRQVGFHDYVAKFDRQSLIAALKEQTADIIQAA